MPTQSQFFYRSDKNPAVIKKAAFVPQSSFLRHGFSSIIPSEIIAPSLKLARQFRVQNEYSLVYFEKIKIYFKIKKPYKLLPYKALILWAL